LGANRKRVCDFLLVRKSNLGPILHHFGDMTAFMCSWPHLYSTVILGVFPLHQIAHVEVSQRMSLKLFGLEIIFEEFQPMRARYRYLKCVTDGQTDSQTLYCGNTALCIASRGENKSLNVHHEFEFMTRRPTYHVH